MTLWTWSQTAANNATADATINWAEGQAPSSVNNSARALMAAVAKFRDDQSGILDSGGTSTAYTVTTNQNLTALTDGFCVYVRIHTTNGAAATFSPDSRTAKAIRTHTGTALPANSLNGGGIYAFTYDSGDDCWYVHNYFSVAALATLAGDNAFTGANTFAGTSSFTAALSAVLASATPLTLRRSETSSDRELLALKGGDGTGNYFSLTGTCSATAITAIQALLGGNELFNFTSAQTRFSRQVAAPAPVALTDASSVTWDWATRQNATLSLAGNRTLSLPSNAMTGATALLRVTATGSDRTLTLASGWVIPDGFSSPLTIVNGSKNLLSAWYDGSNYWLIPNLDAETV